MQSPNYTEKVNNLCKKLSIPTPLPLGQDAVISGSFIWHILTADEKTQWLPKDLDVFCARSAVPRWREYFLNNGFKLCFIQKFIYADEEVENILEEWAVPCTPELSSLPAYKFLNKRCSEYNLPDLPKTVQLSLKKHKGVTLTPHIQLIVADSPLVKCGSELIKGRFDFPTLENWFDGETLDISYPQEVKERKSTIRDRANPAKYSKSLFKDRLQARIGKYEKYGLKFETQLDEISKIKQKLNELIRSFNAKPIVNVNTKIEILDRISQIDNFITQCDVSLLEAHALVEKVIFNAPSVETMGLQAMKEKKARFVEQRNRLIELYKTLN